ncbi:hypothetical protein ACQJBY_006174 [Aegilops geniculata]
MHRRFLNVIVQDLNSRINSLYLVDPWKHLFYRPTGKIEAAEDAKSENKNPAALIDRFKFHNPQFRFESSIRDKPMHFFSALVKENCLLLADSTRNAFLYDIDLNSVQPLPPMYFPKGPNSVYFSAPQENPRYPLHSKCIYVLDLLPATTINSSFEVLNYFSDEVSEPHVRHNYTNRFFWDNLPLPPFLGDAYGRAIVCSSMMIEGSSICISSVEKGVGTYTFDIGANVWTQAGNWVLPFYGKAEYVPELNLFFALSSDSPHRLCALDCSAIHNAGPPTLLHTFEDLDLPENWSSYKCHLVNLGSGNFCIISFCKAMKREFALFTGVEVKHCSDAYSPLRMIKHQSKCFSLRSHSIKCVL